VDLDGDRVGLITYMRTDSVVLADRAVRQAREVVADIYGKDYLPEQPVYYKTQARRAQEAHEAIRPTDLARRPQDVRRYLNDDEFRLYELIWKRTIACQMVAARFERTAVEVTVDAGGEALVFTAGGRQIVFPGFLRAYVEGSDDPEAELGDQETLLPALAERQELEARAVEAEEHVTKPPYRYTEASLVKKLEDEGIGRPSTYASIISTIQERDYVFKRGNELVPTFTAFCVTELLEGQFRDLVETQFTARMEDDLDEVADGKIAWDALVAGFYRGDGARPGLVERVEKGEVTYPAIALGADPESGEEVVVKVGKYGPYVRRGEGGTTNAATIPVDMPPDELTLGRALELLRSKNDETPPLAADPVTGRPITLKVGRFGEYLELGLSAEEKERDVKPRRVSLPRGMKAGDVTAAIAGRLIQLPRTLGRHPESGEEITTGLGRFGPFVKHGDDYRNLESWEQACDLGLGEALAILTLPKKGGSRRRGAPKTVLKEVGEVAGAAGPVRVLDGSYGPYVTDGKVNASLPKGADPQAVTAAQAAELLAAAAERKKSKRGRR
jgi:DNA topoisomerase-1